MPSVKTQLRIAIVYFVILAVLGNVLRLFSVVGLPFNYRYIVHTHSHIALLGWVYLALSAFIYKQFLAGQKTSFAGLFWFTQITLVGMLVSFPVQGYALFSIIFSTLFLFASYWFAWLVLKKTPAEYRSRFSFQCIRMSLWFLVFSSIGPWALGAIMNTLGQASPWYRNAIYFYLHFMYNGFFVMALFGVIFKAWEEQGMEVRLKKEYVFMYSTGVVMTLFLSFLWEGDNGVYYVLGGAGIVSQVVVVGLIIRDIIRHNTPSLFQRVRGNGLLKMAIGLYGIKLLLQLLSSIPTISRVVHTNLDVTIGYLHLTFLGVMSLGLIGVLVHYQFVQVPRIWTASYLAGFVITEFLLFYRGGAAMFGWPVTDQFSRIILAGSLLLLVATVWLMVLAFQRSRAHPN